MTRISCVVALALFAFCLRAEDAAAPAKDDAASRVVPNDGHKDTPMQPNGKWHVHDPDRPQPRVVTPGTESSPEKPGKPPSDAIVLFDGSNLDKWYSKSKAEPCKWIIEKGEMISVKGAGYVFTRDDFGDFQLHVEWAAPVPAQGKGQGRGNSGVFLHGKYEIQVLDSFNNPTYADGTASAVYGQVPPLVNAVRPPGEWQTYDIVFTGPHYKDGKLATPAYVTVFRNGVVVQNHTEIVGSTGHMQVGKYDGKTEKGPIGLQDHGNPVRYRNIWIRPLKAVDE
ncbi:MAG TPA: DUF1080 domain-containing protein [Planctomycetota bacterium]|nr:DUF1080 domain-containing protein [Planctomycetota bacterium]